MKFSIAALVLAAAAYAQSIESEVAMIPSCALTCLYSAIASAGCGRDDHVCQCGSAKNTITTAATPCILGACSTTEALKAQSIANEICTLVAAGSSSVSSTSASETKSSSATGSSTLTTSSTVSGLSTTLTSTSTHSSTTSSPASKSSSSSASAASGVSSTSSSAPATQSTGAASRLEAGMVGAAALLVAFAL